jgi:hypothetical protein
LIVLEFLQSHAMEFQSQTAIEFSVESLTGMKH